MTGCRDAKTMTLARPRVPLVLFASRLNTGGSLMAEAILRYLAQERLRAASAGASTVPCVVNPYAIECLHAHGIDTTGLHSKPWGEFFGVGKPAVRFLIALDDVYAAHADWPVHTLKAHWGTPEPADVVGNDIDIMLAFEETYEILYWRIHEFLSLQHNHLDDLPLLSELERIGAGP